MQLLRAAQQRLELPELQEVLLEGHSKPLQRRPRYVLVYLSQAQPWLVFSHPFLLAEGVLIR